MLQVVEVGVHDVRVLLRLRVHVQRTGLDVTGVGVDTTGGGEVGVGGVGAGHD